MSTSEHSQSGNNTPINDSLLEKEEKGHLPTLPKRAAKDYIFISLCCFLVAFGGFVFGFDTGTISGFVNMDDYLRRFGQHNSSGEYYLSNVRTGLIVSIFNVGCAIGGILLSKCADLWGRRVGLMISMAIYVVGIIVQIASQYSWVQYFIGRLITGVAVGIVSVVSPLFIGESSPKHLRGTLVCCFQLCITLGIFLGYCTNYGTKQSYSDSRTWRIPLGLCFAWAIMLVCENRLDDARNSIARSNKVSIEDPGVYTEVQLIQAGIDREKLAGKAGWLELITGKPKMLYRVIIGIVLQSLQQLTGNYFFYYGTTILRSSKMGRRMCLLTGSACMSVCFIIYSVLGSVNLYIDGYENTPSNTRKPTGNALIFITCLFIFFFASTWAGGVYCIVSETYPLRIRSKAMSVATAANWLWGFLISFFTPFITSAIHFYYETKGLSLEEVDELYASNVVPWKTGSWTPPSVENMATTTGFAAESKPVDEQV
ncbi:hypothetical_protein [Candidozyma auris]|uniref:hypothetical_protein n=1 Tax=Candidozyma auris TaxID=498019 RepID=UPI00125A4D9D|nr:hypothetical_protein [[Candida] auris]QEO23459.1 hypothetical_protein [[Candida] auris]